MMVKNEARIIERAINSAKHLIDYWVIVDTGSTDNTKEVISSALNGIPGELHDREWVNFGVNRTQLMQIAKEKGDYLLLLDGDEVVIDEGFDKHSLTENGYYLRFTGNNDYVKEKLVKNNLDWEWIGVTHEYLHSARRERPVELATLKVKEYSDGGAKTGKFERDIKLLSHGIIDEPDNARYHYYLANSFRDAGKSLEALEYYEKRVAMGGWAEEVWSAMYESGQILLKLGRKQKAHLRFLDAYEYRPSRAESLYRLSNMFNVEKKYNLAYLYSEIGINIPYPKDNLFIERPVYEYLLLFEYSICTYWVGKYEESYNACEKLLSINDLPAEIRERTIQNKVFPAQKLGIET